MFTVNLFSIHTLKMFCCLPDIISNEKPMNIVIFDLLNTINKPSP